MRLYSGKIPAIVADLIRDLLAAEAIVIASDEEVRLDFEAVFKEYLRLDREIQEEAKNRMEQRGMGYSNLGRVKAQVARERGASALEEPLPYLLDQVLNMLFHSNNVEEVFAEDIDLRKIITPVLKKHMDVGDDLDVEVRSKIKNLQEGTATFDIEYARVMDQIRRNRGLE